MYLKTPKRYKRGPKRSPISLRWLWLWLIALVIIPLGIYIYNNRDLFAPTIADGLNNFIDGIQVSVSTVNAPPPLPTKDPTGELEIADQNWREGRIEIAISTYSQLINAVPNDVETHYRLTLGFLMQGRLEEALLQAEKTVTADPFSADAWAIRAMALDWNGNYGLAISSALHALELDDKNVRAMAILAETYFDSENFDAAKSITEQALQLDPDNFEALRVAGMLSQGVDFDLEAALNYYKRAYELAPNLPYVAIDYIELLLSTDQEEALGILQNLIESNPTNTYGLFYLGSYYFRYEGNPEEAAEYLLRCVNANPNSIDCNALLGRVQFSLNNFTQSIEYLQKAIELGSVNSQYYFWLGRSLVSTGNCADAFPILEKGKEQAQQDIQTDVIIAIDEYLQQCNVTYNINPTPTALTP